MSEIWRAVCSTNSTHNRSIYIYIYTVYILVCLHFVTLSLSSGSDDRFFINIFTMHLVVIIIPVTIIIII